MLETTYEFTELGLSEGGPAQPESSGSNDLGVSGPALPGCIALLTDVHNRPCREITSSLERNRPELICIAGDLFHGHTDAKLHDETNSLDLLQACPQLAPTFLSIGNHDWFLTQADLDEIRHMSINVLDNSWKNWHSFVIGGLTSTITLDYRARMGIMQDYKENATPDTATSCPDTGTSNPDTAASTLGSATSYPDTATSTLDSAALQNSFLDDFQQQAGFKLLLCHHPEYYPSMLENRPIDLILSGHAHGGQWRFFGQGVFSPGQGLFPKLTSGIHGNMVISRGLANTGGIIPRINNPTEIIYLR